ncbi:Do family serine endopeptidase [Aliihoeflea sp. PC F10.4]
MTIKISIRRKLAVGVSIAALGLTGLATPGTQAFAQAQPEAGSAQPRQQGPASVADLAEGLLDAVVNISTSQSAPAARRGQRNVPVPQLPEGSPFQEFFDEFFNQQQEGGPSARPMQSLGSGFVIDAVEGIVITNNHVIADADQIEVNFADGGTLSAELIGADPETDLAVLKIDPDARELTAVEFGDSQEIRIGDWVMAVGNPFGLGGSVTIGIVSARGRDINAGRYDDFIQTDAAINRGNSGGPLFDMYGKVIGINTAIISPSGGSIGIGFSIPSQMAVNVINQLREYGETRRGWLGVRIQPVTDDIAESLGMTGTSGALVAGVIEGGPVDDGTIQPGDVILSFNGRSIRQMRDLPRIVAETPVGDEVDVVIVRRGEEQTVSVTLGRLEDSENMAQGGVETPDDGDEDSDVAVEEVEVLGMTLATLDETTRGEFGIGDGVSGVVVMDVGMDTQAAERNIAAGEVITEIAQEAVSTPEDVQARIDTLREQGRRNALLMLASPTGELRFVTLRID